ncbi:MsnO8 family LLM class oxidoreductase [Paenibacillus sp. TRM 82003]|nr:MsnO8 family LLM class oxidoreductase [Paenibacillus sp. TRM 82003]
MKRNKNGGLTLSVLDLVPVFEGTDGSGALAEAVKLAAAAERLGYRRYWAAEHHDMAGLACPAPEILLARIGAATERIRLGTGALLLPHYRPLKVAETFRMLAALYPGRIDLGIGRAPGGSAHATMALSGNFIEHVGKLPAALKDLAALLEDRYALEEVPVVARPIPPASPELWMLGTNRKSAAYAAELGMGYAFGAFMSDVPGEETLRAYREAFVPSASFPAPRTIVAVGVVCADTEDEARSLAVKMTQSFHPEAAGDERDDSSSENRRLIVGTPEQAADRLTVLRTLYGADEFLIVTLIPDYEARLRSYEALAHAAGFASN